MNAARKQAPELRWRLSGPQPAWDVTFRIPAPSEPRWLELSGGALWIEVRERAPK